MQRWLPRNGLKNVVFDREIPGDFPVNDEVGGGLAVGVDPDRSVADDDDRSLEYQVSPEDVTPP